MKTSLKEVDTFALKTHGKSDEQTIQMIKNYNDCALFSSEYEREVSQENAHIHFLLKYIEKSTGAPKRTPKRQETEDLTDEQKSDVRKFAAKFEGIGTVLNIFNQSCVRMSMDLFGYVNRQENEAADAKKYPERKRIAYTTSNLEQSLGAVIAYAMMLRVLLEDKYPSSALDTSATVTRWLDNAKYHAENKES